MNNQKGDLHLGSTPTESSADDPMCTSRDGLTFQLVTEPDGGAWVEIARIDGVLIAFEPLPPDVDDIVAFSDDWVAARLSEISPVHRCADCGLPVEVIDPYVVHRHRPNHAVDYDLWVEFAVGAHDELEEDDGRYVRLTLCVTCRNDLSRRHPWLGKLLPLPQNRRRIR